MTLRRKSHRSKKGIFKTGLSAIQKTSSKIMPGVKKSIEKLGKTVRGNAIPSAKSSLRSLFRLKKTKTNRNKSRSRKTRKH